MFGIASDWLLEASAWCWCIAMLSFGTRDLPLAVDQLTTRDAASYGVCGPARVTLLRMRKLQDTAAKAGTTRGVPETPVSGLLRHDPAHALYALMPDTPQSLVFSTHTLTCAVCLVLLVSIGGFGASTPALAQDDDRPPIEDPVVVAVAPAADAVAPGDASALVVTFKLPKFMWLGAQAGKARTPAGTQIRMMGHPAFSFGAPAYPEPSVEGVPVHVGTTRVYEGEVQVVVPFEVAAEASAGTHTVEARITYTPGFNAGSLATHANERHTATITVRTGASAGRVPAPSVASVDDDFIVRRDDGYPTALSPMFHAYEPSGFTGVMHTLFIDPPNHGKTIRHAPFPFISSSNQEGLSIGGGVTFLNTTREGIMTGSLGINAFHNEFLGAGLGFDYLSCPAAYKNLQISGRFSGGDYRELQLAWEDFTVGERDRWGFQVDGTAMTDPRTRFYGIGAGTKEEDVAVYDHREAGGTLDVYHFPAQKLRVGLGVKARYVEVGRGLDDIDEIVDGFIPALLDLDRFANVPGLGGATVLGGRFNVIYDGRNQEFNPSSGFFGKFTAEVNEVVDDQRSTGLVDTYGRFLLDLRQYLSTIDKRWQLVLRSEATFTTDERVPFFDQAQLGGFNSLRAFDEGRFYGQHALFGSLELRRKVGNVKVMSFPMTVLVSTFLDGGQVFNSEVGDDFNLNPGMAVRFANPPNVGFTLNVAYGQDGFYSTGGISLPI